MTFRWMDQHVRCWPVELMCSVLGVSRAGFYRWRKNRVSGRSSRREELTVKIRQVHEMSDRTYGSPRVTRELKAAGIEVCENTVAKYMREREIRASGPGRFVPQTTDSNHSHPIAPNRLKQDFEATGVNQKWVSDLTYVWTEEGWLYLSVVIDLYSRRVVGWSMNADLKASGPVAALEMAIERRRPGAGLIHHSDRGVQYACGAYRSVLSREGLLASMSRSGNCYDNAVAESFFGSLKTERVNRRRYRTREEARASVFEWIEMFYNRRRRHSSIGYMSPEAFEAQNN